MQKDNGEYSLTHENLIPFYLIEDRIKQNFAKIERFISAQLALNASNGQQIANLNKYNNDYKEQIGRKFIEQQKKINSEISADLEGRIIVAINKNMGSILGRLEQKERQIAQVSQAMNNKLQTIKKEVLNDATKQNQKSISREMQKLQKKMKTNIEEGSKKTGVKGSSSGRPESRGKDILLKSKHQEGNGGPQSYFSQEWVIKIKDLDSRTARIEQFMVGFDKRLYENMTSLKDSWKQFGEDVLQTKRKLTVRQDELKLQLVKLKAIRQFQGSPQEMEETFKTKVINKFTDIYQLISQVATRTDLDSQISRLKKSLVRHDSQLSDLRQQNAKNSDYFTFYMNNSNTDDLSAQIKSLQEDLMKKQILTLQKAKKQAQKSQEVKQSIYQVSETIETQAQKLFKTEHQVSRLREILLKQMDRIDIIEQSNKITPQKMGKIHNMLDIDFSPSEEELINKKKYDVGQNSAVKQLRIQVSRLKDELFILANQNIQMEKLKKFMNGLQTKLDKLKIQSQEAILSRKPWVCLSCDKNEKQKGDLDRLKRDGSKKKLTQNKAAFFTKEKSDKLIKLIPSSQQKFEIYQKYRQKYLSDSIKLPDIYKEKIGDKQLLI